MEIILSSLTLANNLKKYNFCDSITINGVEKQIVFSSIAYPIEQAPTQSFDYGGTPETYTFTYKKKKMKKLRKFLESIGDQPVCINLSTRMRVM